jgi:hypothetical protein
VRNVLWAHRCAFDLEILTIGGKEAQMRLIALDEDHLGGAPPRYYRHIRSRLAGMSVVGPDFLAAFAGPGPRSPQC